MKPQELGFQANIDGYLLSDNPLIGKPGQGAWEAGWNDAQTQLRGPWELSNHERAKLYA